MEYVSNLADVSPGDLVMTSGLDGIYPRGYVIGRIEKAERGSGLYRLIAIRPRVDFSSLDTVLLVTGPQPAPPAAASSSASPAVRRNRTGRAHSGRRGAVARGSGAMTRLVVVGVAILGALMLQTVVGYQLFGRVIAMDLVLVVVVGTSSLFGPTGRSRLGGRPLSGRVVGGRPWGGRAGQDAGRGRRRGDRHAVHRHQRDPARPGLGRHPWLHAACFFGLYA